MAGFSKPKVYTGVSAALSIVENNVKTRVAYLTGFTLDLTANSEDFNVLGQRYQESIPTYNAWTASADGKASFENEGQRKLFNAYNTNDFVLCEFVLNSGKDYYGDIDQNAVVLATGYASIDNLSIDVGDGVTGISISLKGTGGLGFKYPTIVPVSAISLDQSTLTLGVGETKQLVATITPTNASNVTIEWTSSDSTKVKVDENGFVYAVAATESPVTITAKSPAGEDITATCSVTVQ